MIKGQRQQWKTVKKRDTSKGPGYWVLGAGCWVLGESDLNSPPWRG
jgi:hypothetical protein